MSILDALLTLLGVINIFLFVSYNKYRLNKIIYFLTIYINSDVNKENKNKVKRLLNNYKGHFGYILFFPNKREYDFLYCNSFFTNTYKKCMLINFYFLAFLILFVISKIYLY
jgi:hypothetical protein